MPLDAKRKIEICLGKIATLPQGAFDLFLDSQATRQGGNFRVDTNSPLIAASQSETELYYRLNKITDQADLQNPNPINMGEIAKVYMGVLKQIFITALEEGNYNLFPEVYSLGKQLSYAASKVAFDTRLTPLKTANDDEIEPINKKLRDDFKLKNEQLINDFVAAALKDPTLKNILYYLYNFLRPDHRSENSLTPQNIFTSLGAIFAQTGLFVPTDNKTLAQDTSNMDEPARLKRAKEIQKSENDSAAKGAQIFNIIFENETFQKAMKELDDLEQNNGNKLSATVSDQTREEIQQLEKEYPDTESDMQLLVSHIDDFKKECLFTLDEIAGHTIGKGLANSNKRALRVAKVNETKQLINRSNDINVIVKALTELDRFNQDKSKEGEGSSVIKVALRGASSLDRIAQEWTGSLFARENPPSDSLLTRAKKIQKDLTLYDTDVINESGIDSMDESITSSPVRSSRSGSHSDGEKSGEPIDPNPIELQKIKEKISKVLADCLNEMDKVLKKQEKKQKNDPQPFRAQRVTALYRLRDRLQTFEAQCSTVHPADFRAVATGLRTIEFEMNQAAEEDVKRRKDNSKVGNNASASTDQERGIGAIVGSMIKAKFEEAKQSRREEGGATGAAIYTVASKLGSLVYAVDEVADKLGLPRKEVQAPPPNAGDYMRHHIHPGGHSDED